MADIVSELASKCGINNEAAKKVLGAILNFLNTKLPPETFAKVRSSLPGADNIMASVEDAGEQTSGGVMGAVKGAIGKLVGGGVSEALVSQLSQLGISADQIPTLIPKVMEFLKSKLPENVMNQISSLLPTTQEVHH